MVRGCPVTFAVSPSSTSMKISKLFYCFTMKISKLFYCFTMKISKLFYCSLWTPQGLTPTGTGLHVFERGKQKTSKKH